jgi:hypothetical protein
MSLRQGKGGRAQWRRRLPVDRAVAGVIDSQ